MTLFPIDDNAPGYEDFEEWEEYGIQEYLWDEAEDLEDDE